MSGKKGNTKRASSGTKKRRKRKKDPNAPKRPRTAYILFCADIRPRTKAENPDAKPSEMLQIMGRIWKEMTEEQKIPYKESALEDKSRFERDMEGYDAPEASSESESDNGRRRRRRKKDPNEPKRALSAYLFFGQEKREEVKQANPEAKQPEIIRILGAMWRNLSDEDKIPFNEKAALDKQRYARQKAQYDQEKQAKADPYDSESEGSSDEMSSEEEE